MKDPKTPFFIFVFVILGSMTLLSLYSIMAF